MTFPPYTKAGVVVLGILSIFWLPWVCSIVLMFLAGLVTPLAALGIGVLADFLYYPGHGWPWGVTVGLIMAATSAAVRHLVRTRIM